MLYVNADDFGLTGEVTGRILDCYHKGSIHGCSAMTFMEDSQRAAKLGCDSGIPTGLHLNLTQEFSGKGLPSTLKAKHNAIASYLNAHKISQLIFNPFLHRSMDYVFEAQWDEYCRLYGREPGRVDGHHHMHLCMNMLASLRIPNALQVRKNFTFGPGEKPPLNRLYRHLVDGWLKSRFICTDCFFSLKPLEPERIMKIMSQAKTADVELMAHPGVDQEYRYLMGADWLNLLQDNHYSLPAQKT